MSVSLAPAAEISLVVIAVINVLLLGGLVGAALIGMREFKKLREQIQPIIDRVNPILEGVRPVVESVHTMAEGTVKPMLTEAKGIVHKASEMASDVNEHVHSIAELSESVVRRLSQKIETTGSVVADGVSQPVINAASALAGFTRALSVLKEYDQSDGNSARPTQPADAATAANG